MRPSNWNLEVLILTEGGKPENPEKNPQSKGENQQTTLVKYDAKPTRLSFKQTKKR
jgi:hypothetical protein